jgi:hypothetical protein
MITYLLFVHLPLNECHSEARSLYLGNFDGTIPLGFDVVRSNDDAFFAILIYNIAVVTHMIGLSESESCPLIMLGKAMSFY